MITTLRVSIKILHNVYIKRMSSIAPNSQRIEAKVPQKIVFLPKAIPAPSLSVLRRNRNSGDSNKITVLDSTSRCLPDSLPFDPEKSHFHISPQHEIVGIMKEVDSVLRTEATQNIKTEGVGVGFDEDELKLEIKIEPEDCYEPDDPTNIPRRSYVGKKDPKGFMCIDCGLVCKKYERLVEHRYLHTGEKPYACSKCDFKTTRQSSLTNHTLYKHLGKKSYSYECKDCQFISKTPTGLKRHLMRHTGEKPYSCSECDYRCVGIQNLKLHVMTHTGETLYRCHSCDYKCIHFTSIKRHLMTHTGEKPYACDQCGRRFLEAKSLKRHLMSHSGKKPFLCPQCNQSFIQLTDVKRHLRTHSGIKPFTCVDCDFTCIRSQHLRQHIALKHSAAIPNK